MSARDHNILPFTLREHPTAATLPSAATGKIIKLLSRMRVCEHSQASRSFPGFSRFSFVLSFGLLSLSLCLSGLLTRPLLCSIRYHSLARISTQLSVTKLISAKELTQPGNAIPCFSPARLNTSPTDLAKAFRFPALIQPLQVVYVRGSERSSITVSLSFSFVLSYSLSFSSCLSLTLSVSCSSRPTTIDGKASDSTGRVNGWPLLLAISIADFGRNLPLGCVV